MPSTVVQTAFGVAIAVGLLGAYYDRRALLFVVAVLVFPEADTLLGWALDGGHRTALHNGVLVVVAAAALWWDASREDSWIRGRFGPSGVRLAWVGLFAHAFAHVAMDWAHLQGVNLLWPIHDQFFRLEGSAYLSSTDGFVQTFVEVAEDAESGERRVDYGGGESRRETHVSNPAQPSPDPDPGPVDRRFPVAVQGWQLYLIAVGVFTLAARALQTPRYAEEDDA